MSFNNMMESAKYLSFSFMASRFIDLTQEDKKIDTSELEFLIRIFYFFEAVMRGRKSTQTFKITGNTLDDLTKYHICLQIIPRMYNDSEMKKFDSVILNFKKNIETVIKTGEIVKDGLNEETKFFTEFRHYCTSKHSQMTMGCH